LSQNGAELFERRDRGELQRSGAGTRLAKLYSKNLICGTSKPVSQWQVCVALRSFVELAANDRSPPYLQNVTNGPKRTFKVTAAKGWFEPLAVVLQPRPE